MPAPLKKLVLAPVLVSAAVFATLTLPLAFPDFAKKPVTIQLQEEPIFSGKIRDIAAPYLGLASILSLGAGFASVAIAGWMNSTRKSSQVEAQLSNLRQNLQEKEAQLEALKLSESQLEAAGLSAFLDEETTLKPEAPQPSISPEASTIVAETPPPKVEARVITAQPFIAQPIVQSAPTPRTAQAFAVMFPTAQSAFGYMRHQAKTADFVVPRVTQLTPLDVSLDVKELHTKLEQIRAQMATLQNAIASSAPENTIATASEETSNSSSRLQVVNWTVNKMSS